MKKTDFLTGRGIVALIFCGAILVVVGILIFRYAA